jgi:hypothetical protein
MVNNRKGLYKLKITSIPEMIRLNNQKGYKRCYGNFYLNRFGYVRITRCNRWDCWLCGGEKIETLRQSAMITAEYIRLTNNVYFSTWEYVESDSLWDYVEGDSFNFEFQRKYAEAFHAWLVKFRNRIKKRGEKLTYVAVHAIGKSGKLHTHLITSHETEGDEITYCETAENIEAVVNYLFKNLKDSLKHNYDKGLHRFLKSRNVPITRKTKTNIPYEIEVKINNKTFLIGKTLLTDCMKLGFKPNHCRRCRRVVSGFKSNRCQNCRRHDKNRRHAEAILKHVMLSDSF